MVTRVESPGLALDPCQLLSCSFNQDQQCISVGTTNGFRIYNVTPFVETFRREFNPPGGISYVEMLFRCNILALVGGGRNPRYPPNKVLIWDDHQTRCIGELSFRSEVRGVRLRRDRIIVILDTKIYVYNFADLKLLDHIETGLNPEGLCAVCPLPSSHILACPGLQRGHARLEHYHLPTRPITLVPAHESDLSALALNSDGSLLATASKKGTLIRIWDTMKGTLQHEVRRGSDRACVTSLAFNQDSSYLVASSDKGTVHIFSLATTTTTSASPGSRSSWTGLLPAYFSSSWSHSRFRVPTDSPTIVAFDSDPNTIVAISMNGRAYKARFDPNKPGDCTDATCLEFVKSNHDNITKHVL